MVLEYLKKNAQLSQNTIEEFEIGFAPGGESLVLYLINLGYNINDVVKSRIGD